MYVDLDKINESEKRVVLKFFIKWYILFKGEVEKFCKL